MNRYICIHGHFYQPARENPWLETIELQDSAYPYHDWNDRITAECYAPNTASRILDTDRNIIDIVNNYSKISFNFGPTLLIWLERYWPDIYQSILDADRMSMETFSGHGSALAQVYNHIIMPLANSRDKETQIIWGIRDFENRFRRKPEGMWLSETAVDIETLDLLAEHGIKFTILAPHQAKKVRPLDSGEDWHDVGGSVDTRMPYLCNLPSGKTISLFFYDGGISHAVSFKGLLKNGMQFADHLINGFDDNSDRPQLVHIATDGESYGHHHRFGDMALSYCLHHIESGDQANVIVYSEFLEKFPPTHEVMIVENSSWSCAHGIERWRSDCGCHIGRKQGWNQKWRTPLRESLDWLRDSVEPLFERETAEYVNDPWEARNDYISVVNDRTPVNIEYFFTRHKTRELKKREKIELLKLFELQRHCMLMYTSCGWFFDEVSGIETVQIMRYASRVIQLAEMVGGGKLEDTFVRKLAEAKSNVPGYVDGARIYNLWVKTTVVDLLRVAAHYAISSLFKEYPEMAEIYFYRAHSEILDVNEAGAQKLIIGKTHVYSNITWENREICFAVLYLGGHNVIGGVSECIDKEKFEQMRTELMGQFDKSDVHSVIRSIDTYFKDHNYSLWHLFRDDQRTILNNLLNTTMEDIEGSFYRIYEYNYPIIKAMREMEIALPEVFANIVEFVLNNDLRTALEIDIPDIDKVKRLIEQMNELSFKPNIKTLNFVASKKINGLMERFLQIPKEIRILKIVEGLFEVLQTLQPEYDLWKAQNVYFYISKKMYSDMKEKADNSEPLPLKWIYHFDKLGDHLQVKVK